MGDSFFSSKTEIVTTDFVHDATTTHTLEGPPMNAATAKYGTMLSPHPKGDECHTDLPNRAVVEVGLYTR